MRWDVGVLAWCGELDLLTFDLNFLLSPCGSVCRGVIVGSSVSLAPFHGAVDDQEQNDYDSNCWDDEFLQLFAFAFAVFVSIIGVCANSLGDNTAD